MCFRQLSCAVAMFFALSFSCASADEAGVRRVLIICGHPGDEAHHKLYAETIERLQKGLTSNLDVSADQIDVQFGASPMPEDPAVITAARGGATREEITANVAKIQAELQPEDSLWVIVMGHAHFDGRTAHLNLPGPDVRADEFGKLFSNISCREQVFFMTCAVSGYFIKPLTAPFRVIMTATEADREINETNNAQALAAVLTDPPYRGAFDVDQDGKLTLLDLYIVLVRRVIEMYAANTAVVTEHSLLEDNGDGRGGELQIDYLTEEQGGRWKPGDVPPKPKRDGIFSSRIVLSITVSEVPPDDPADALSPENASADASSAG